MNEDELKAEAEELAEDKKPADLARMAFVYSYVANHELRMVLNEMRWIKKMVLGIGATFIATVFGAVCKMIWG